MFLGTKLYSCNRNVFYFGGFHLTNSDFFVEYSPLKTARMFHESADGKVCQSLLYWRYTNKL